MNMRALPVMPSNVWSSEARPAFPSMDPNYSSLANWGGGMTAPNFEQMPINLAGMAPGSVGQTFEPGFMDKMLGYRAADGTQFAGWGGLALGAANGLMNGFMGMKQLGVAKDQLAQSKRQFDINFGAQKKLTNSRLEDRQAARVASNPGAYQSVGDYMKKNGI
jgi:hypothetical protein